MIVSALDRKLLRDLWEMKGQVLAISLVMACGVATFVMSLSTLKSLTHTQATYYERYRFAEVFAQLKRAPDTLALRIAEISGVAQVQRRVVEDVTLDVPGMAEPAVGRLISIPEHREPLLNALYLRRGRHPEPSGDGEVLVSEAFAEAHGLEPGDTVSAVINGRRQTLNLVGVALSPEYIYQIKPGDLLPDDKHFGVFWIPERELAAAFDMEGAFNNVTLSLMPGASEPEVLRRLDRLIEPYGGHGAYGREDQTSHKLVSDEIRGLRGNALIAPVIFLGVAAFLMNMVLSRLIATQREQIAALKAFGYSRLEIGLHYLKLAFLIVVIGVGLGTAVGVWLGQALTELYTRFFRFPVFGFHLGPDVVALALLASGAAGFLGVINAVRWAVKLPPAEAMRPEPPAAYRPTLIERLGLQRLFAHSVRMVLRRLERQPVKAALSCLGIALAVTVLIVGTFVEDTVEYVIEYQFFTSQRQDMSLNLVEPSPIRVLHDMRHLPGVRYLEPFRSVPVRLRAGHRERRLGILGLPPERHLYRLLDADEEPVSLPPEGLVLSAKLAEILHVAVGDTLLVEVFEKERPVRRAPVAGLVTDFSGLAAYMDIRALNRLLREGDTVSGAFLAVDAKHIDALYAQLKQTPRVAGVVIKRMMLESFRQTLAENILVMKFFNTLFAAVIALGVMYNSARITLSERSRELATLRVLGFTRREIAVILLGEIGLLTLAAVPMGLFMGYGGAALITLAMNSETYRFPLVIEPATYAFAVAVLLVAALLSAVVVQRRLARLDLLAVLKSRE